MKKFIKFVSLACASAMLLSTTAFAEGETFKIGGIGPMTGAAAIYGNAVMNGAQIAVDEINAAGGVNGVQLEFNPQDDEHDAEKSVNAYNSLKDWGMQMLLGSVTSAPCIAVEAEAVNDNMFLLTPSGTAVDCIYGENAFRVCFSDPSQGTESAKFIAENGLAEKVAVIYNNSDVYSTGIYGAFKAKAAELQAFEIVSEEAFTADGATDFSVQLQKAKEAGADLVFLPFYYNEASLVFAQAASIGYEPKWFGVDGMDGILTLEGFDTSLAEDVMLLTPFSATAEDELTKNFVAKYEELYGETPNQFAADAYDGIYILKAALEQAGATPDMEYSAICDALKVAMTEITYTGVTGTDITWGTDGEPIKAPIAVVIKDGAYEFM